MIQLWTVQTPWGQGSKKKVLFPVCSPFFLLWEPEWQTALELFMRHPLLGNTNPDQSAAAKHSCEYPLPWHSDCLPLAERLTSYVWLYHALSKIAIKLSSCTPQMKLWSDRRKYKLRLFYKEAKSKLRLFYKETKIHDIPHARHSLRGLPCLSEKDETERYYGQIRKKRRKADLTWSVDVGSPRSSSISLFIMNSSQLSLCFQQGLFQQRSLWVS